MSFVDSELFEMKFKYMEDNVKKVDDKVESIKTAFTICQNNCSKCSMLAGGEVKEIKKRVDDMLDDRKRLIRIILGSIVLALIALIIKV